MTWRALFFAIVTVLAVASSAHAQEAPDAPITAHRARPDYDGRAEPGPDAGEVLLWVPRVVFFPVTLVLDYGIRRPIGLVLETAERERWPTLLLDALTWNERRSGIVPTFFVAYGLQPSGGLLFFSNDDVAPGHSLGASFNFGGVDYLQGSASYAIATGSGFRVELRGEGGRRPDRVFSGLGWDARAVQYRFREAWYEAQLGVRADRFWRESRIEVITGVDGHEFDPRGYAALSNNSPSMAEGIAQGEIQAPPGLDRPYAVSRSRASFALDTREPEPAPGHGVRVEAHGELVFDLDDPMRRRWARWGGGVGTFLDLGAHRVLGLWGIARFADPLGDEEIPFTDLIALGEEELLMQGFLRGQLRGRSAVATTLEYRYPIWTRLDGRLHVSVGNAFGAHLEDFALERLRLSFGMGIATAGEPDGAVEIAVAAGTAPFVDGAGIDSVQLVFGSRQGF
ncbi:hypothetical protein [Sandaracinus amylolyticus]|uniref:Bacterial surface antigen (D15) domain-containing protein n=1 Tax=Sandaracinus amylolyticus TaxID=927083 RepID=A0A0F6SHX5_9BACT|nr:hypothetical protein [Sandaracinus amylolyticus]AKF11204.1 hypothetical protein DB32_008353 [Sandaracinus amylolyticus]